MTAISLAMAASCRVKPEQLPFLAYPYLFEIEFLKHVENDNGKAKKEYFKDGVVRAPFYFLLNVKELEDQGVIRVRFYDAGGRKVAEKSFFFGVPGKYYEYIICFDRVDDIPPGAYRYAVFFNDGLIFDGQVTIGQSQPGT